MFKLKMYEVRLRPVLKRQRFWHWILDMWLYTTHERQLNLLRDEGLVEANDSREERFERKQSLLHRHSMVESEAVRMQLKWAVSRHCTAFSRQKAMNQIDARNKALYGACDAGGQASRDWRTLADGVLPEVEASLKRAGSLPDDNLDKAVLQRVRSMQDCERAKAGMLLVRSLSVGDLRDAEATACLAEDEAIYIRWSRISEDKWSRILEEKHDPIKFLKGSRYCGKGLLNERADAKISKALLCTSMSDDSEEEYMQKGSLFWSVFWKQRPTKPAHGVSMVENPCRFWASVNHLSERGECQPLRCESGTTCHCKEHRCCNMSHQLFRSLDPGVTVNLGVVAHAAHSNDLGIRMRDVSQALLNPDLASNTHTDFHTRVRAAVEVQNAQEKGPSWDEAILMSRVKIQPGQDVKLGIDKPNEARWISNFKLADDVSRGENWLAIAVLRAKGHGEDDEAEVRAAAAILSYEGFVPSEHPTLDIDPPKRHLFRILVSPQAKESRYMMAAVYQLVLHPLMALTGDVKRNAGMMGVHGLPRRLLLVIQHGIWRSTGPKAFESAIAHRADNAKVGFRNDSMRFINPECEDVIRRIMGDDLPEGILKEMVDAIPTLLRRMRNLAMTPGRVVPDTTRLIFAFLFDYLYDSDGSLKDKHGNEVMETFPIKMSQMQLHFRIMLNDALPEVRKAFAREIGSPSSFATGASLEQFSQGTVLGKHIPTSRCSGKRGGHEGDGEGHNGSY
jgi:hypothetical protein